MTVISAPESTSAVIVKEDEWEGDDIWIERTGAGGSNSES
jgi:hypothetical protein